MEMEVIRHEFWSCPGDSVVILDDAHDVEESVLSFQELSNVSVVLGLVNGSECQ